MPQTAGKGGQLDRRRGGNVLVRAYIVLSVAIASDTDSGPENGDSAERESGQRLDGAPAGRPGSFSARTVAAMPGQDSSSAQDDPTRSAASGNGRGRGGNGVSRGVASPGLHGQASAQDSARGPRGASPVVGLGRVRVVSYANVANAHLYRALMQLFFANRQEYGQPLSPPQVAERLRHRFGMTRDVVALVADLDALVEWGALESQHDPTRAKRASELVRKQFIYDITAEGELTERYLEQLDGLVAQAGSLQGTRLPAILGELGRLADELGKPDPDPSALQASLTNLVAALEELRRGASDFMRDLNAVMHSSDALDEDAFRTYKSRVLEYLEGFRLDLENFSAAITDAIDAVEAHGVDRMVELIASIEEAPTYNVSAEETRRRAAAARAAAWKGVRNWFVGSFDHPPPFAMLDAKLLEAIGWILRAVQRLKERRSHRIDRSVEYRRLARVFHDASDEECHAIYAAAFGLFAPRHFGGLEEDPELTPPQCSFWEAPVPLIEAHLRNPSRRPPGPGRGAQVADNSMAQEMMRQRRERERAELAEALRRFSANGPVRLRDVGRLNETEFSHLLGWLGRALETSAGADGRLTAESTDGLAIVALKPPADPRPTVTLNTPRGQFHTPDYTLEVEPE